MSSPEKTRRGLPWSLPKVCKIDPFSCGRNVFYKSYDTDTSVKPGSRSTVHTGTPDGPGSSTAIWRALWFPMRLWRGF